MKPKIWLSSPHMGGTELKYINEAFETNWIAPLGANVNSFESDLSLYLGGVHCAALSSGTAAIHLALIMIGVEKGDVIICQSFTFSATANPIVYLGANPIFIDSESDTWNMDPNLLEQAINESLKKGKKPKAIIFVNLYGMPAKIEDILFLANKYEIPVIEDAAESLGSRYKGIACGNFGKMSVLSFNGNKIITTSGGGALVSKDNNYITKARFLATQARDDAPHYQHSEIGYNYRMSNVVAGVGRGQMEVLENRIAVRRENNRFYRSILKDFDGISFQNEPIGHFSNYWLTTILVNKDKCGVSREDIRLAMEKESIETRPLWKPMHLQPVFNKYLTYSSSISEKYFNNGLCLPSGSNLVAEEKERIKECLLKILSK